MIIPYFLIAFLTALTALTTLTVFFIPLKNIERGAI